VAARRRTFQARTHPPANIQQHVIGRRVRWLRQDQDMTAGELAARCHRITGIDRTAIRSFEAGRFPWYRIGPVADALGINPSDLMRGTLAWHGYRQPPWTETNHPIPE
jgi:hypothetical protein